jgi:hypothetical protein
VKDETVTGDPALNENTGDCEVTVLEIWTVTALAVTEPDEMVTVAEVALLTKMDLVPLIPVTVTVVVPVVGKPVPVSARDVTALPIPRTAGDTAVITGPAIVNAFA